MDTPLAQTYSNQKVFKAAVNALGSNSRNWASFVKVRDQHLEGLLYDFDPEKIHTAVLDGTLTLADLREHLSGQGRRRYKNDHPLGEAADQASQLLRPDPRNRAPSSPSQPMPTTRSATIIR